MTASWHDHRDELSTRLSSVPRVLVACDFDGTLAPIVERPAGAALGHGAEEVLVRLAALHPRARLAFLSGRSLADLASRLPRGLACAVLAGNHGLELSGAGLDWCHPAALAARPQLDLLAECAREFCASVPGLEFEHKGASLTLHYRRVAAQDKPRIIEAVHAWRLPPDIRRHEGKMIVEFRPDVDWDKGMALRRIMTRLGVPASAAMYLGDDVTDEDAFQVLRDTGITLYIGDISATTCARLRATDPADAIAFLDFIARTLSGG